MKLVSYVINLFAGIVVLIIGIQSMDTFSLGAIGFLIWAISPYLFSAFLMKRSTDDMAIKILFGISLIVAVGGIYLLVDAMYIHPDAQGALAFVVIPMYQWVILLFTALLNYFIYKIKKGKK